MIVIIMNNTVTDRDAYLPLAKLFVADAKCDAGCLGMEILVPEDDPDHVTFIHKWEKKSDFDAHCLGKAFEKHIPRLAPYYVSGETTIYNSLSE